jgi:prefoldin subunit 5
MPNMETMVERVLAKYYGQIRELNHKLKFTRRSKERIDICIPTLNSAKTLNRCLSGI